MAGENISGDIASKLHLATQIRPFAIWKYLLRVQMCKARMYICKVCCVIVEEKGKQRHKGSFVLILLYVHLSMVIPFMTGVALLNSEKCNIYYMEYSRVLRSVIPKLLQVHQFHCYTARHFSLSHAKADRKALKRTGRPGSRHFTVGRAQRQSSTGILLQDLAQTVQQAAATTPEKARITATRRFHKLLLRTKVTDSVDAAQAVQQQQKK